MPADEGTRANGERRTTSGSPAAPIVRGAWCSPTKEQGLTGRGAPRPARRLPQLFGGRGARRRRKKGYRGEVHHVRPAGYPNCSRDVVLVDEGTRASGEGGTTSGPPAAPIVRGGVVLVNEGTRASGEGGTTSGPPTAHRSPNRAGKDKTVRLARK